MDSRPKETPAIGHPCTNGPWTWTHKLGKIDNHRQEPWKAPLPEFIEEIFYKRFKKERPDVVKPLKQILKEQEIKTKTKKKEKEIRRKEREQEQINNGTDEVLTFQSPTSITE